MGAIFRHESFLLELPFDVGLPERLILHVKDDEAGPPTPGWEHFDLNRYLGLPGGKVPPQIPSSTLMFSLAPGRAILPWRAVEKAWPRIFKWMRQSGNRRARIAPIRLARRLRATRKLRRVPISVVQVVRLAPRPATYDEDWRWAQLANALDHLNDFLAAVMSVRRDPEISPIGLRDLPPLVYGFGWDLEADDSRSPVEWQLYMANDRLMLDHPRMTSEEADLAAWLSRAKGHPLYEAGSFLSGGWSSAQRGRYAHAVAEAGTAIEVLSAGAVRLAAPHRGYSAEKLANVLDGPFASLIHDHFAVIFGYSRAPLTSHDALGDWWRDAYLLRNRVVHDGYRPTEPETVKALDSAETLVRDLYGRLSANEEFRSLLLPIPDDVWAAAEQHGAGPVPRSFEEQR